MVQTQMPPKDDNEANPIEVIIGRHMTDYAAYYAKHPGFHHNKLLMGVLLKSRVKLVVQDLKGLLRDE